MIIPAFVQNDHIQDARTLIDIGALYASYIDSSLADTLLKQGVTS